MSDSTVPTVSRAVFLSYAREDSAAARRIAEALRDAGVEVWFDQSELRGGDAWDQKIRKQIKDCALFVPIVSAHTQDRGEGYFRLEWKLAVERTHHMAEGIPFLAPVALDRSHEADALVPPEFMRVHWTRLADGIPTQEFVGQIKRLLDAPRKSTAMRKAESAGPQFSPPITAVPKRDEVPAAPLLPHATSLATAPSVGRALRTRIIWAAALVAIASVVLVLWLRRPAAESPETRRQDAAATSSQPAPASPRLGPKSIAVLPFENLNEDKDANAFFADGMHEDVITNLLLIRDLRCVPRNTVMAYAGTKKTTREIADELGVAYVLTATVRRADKKVRITGTLLNARTDEPLWSKPYDKDLTDIFAIQSELAQAIAGELKATLSPQEKKLVERRPTENTAAYDLFVQARELRFSNLTDTKARKAETLLQAAVALDPKFALAWGELSYAHGYLYLFYADHTPERAAKAKAAIETAVRLAPDGPEMTLYRGYYSYFCLRDYAQADQWFTQAGFLQPNSPAPYFARALIQRRQSRWSEARDGFRTAAQIDPGNYDYAVQVALLESRARQWDATKAARRRLYELRPVAADAMARNLALYTFWATGSTREIEAVLARLPAGGETAALDRTLHYDLALMQGDLPGIVRWGPSLNATGENLEFYLPVATALIAQGKAAEVRAQLAEIPAMIRARLDHDPENAQWWGALGLVEALLGHNDEARRCAQKAVALVPESVDSWVGVICSADRAFVHAWTGDKETALAEYVRLLKIPAFNASGSGSWTAAGLNVHAMRHHPFYFPLQGDPRFETILNDPKNNAPLF